MKKENLVFIAQSLDGYIADKNGGLAWLESVPNPDGIDMGYRNFVERVDAIIMGRITFETICSFGIDWPFTKPVFVLSNNVKSVDEELTDKVEIVNGSLISVLETINAKGYNKLYIDGGQVIQSFLKEDLIDEMTITTIPILLGGGHSLFGDLDHHMSFDLIQSEVFLDTIVQSTYKRKK
ncbi:dihydrofolate reductase family protein [Ancylomarina sp. DW003]|nr:dihydrofolate reductase family protein [Ancylomarina sp. DW003]MDE5423858.1 dihydrofolate reductase family protein [Ancylomarina sp. DW003]